MKIVEKYLWRSVLLPTGFVIASLFTLWLMFDIFDQIGRLIEHHPPHHLLVKYFLVQLPSLAQSILPVASLFATLYVLAYFSRHRESVALMSSGMSPVQIARPFFACGILLSLLLYVFAYSLSPTAQASRRETKRQIGKVPTERSIFRQVVYRSPTDAVHKNGSLWYIGEIDIPKQRISEVEILVRAGTEQRELYKLFCTSADYANGAWRFHGVRRIDYGDEAGSQAIGPYLDELMVPELNEPPETLAARLLPPDELPWPEVAKLAGDHGRLNDRLRAPYITENWFRLAYPLSCPLLCLFGVVFGMTDSRRNVAASVFNSVFVLFGFLVCTRLFVAMGQGNRIPPFLAGAGSILLFGIAGLYLFAGKVGWLWELQGWSRQHPLVQSWLRRIPLLPT